ncbi:MAG: DUF2357 domain-containing protein [Bacillota bacterium]
MDIELELFEEQTNNTVIRFQNQPQNYSDDVSLYPVYADHGNHFYSIRIKAKEPMDQYKIEVFINNEKVEIKHKDQNKKEIRLGGNDRNVFELICAVTDIYVEITPKGEDMQQFYSPLLIVCVKNDKELNSLRNMLEYIYDKKETLLRNKKERQTAPETEGWNLNERMLSLSQEVEVLNWICKNYEDMFRQFMDNSVKKTVGQQQEDHFYKLKNIDINTIHHIVQHPQELQCINEPVGISVNNQYYIPEKTLLSRLEFTANIYENQIIVQFLNTLVAHVQKRTSSFAPKKSEEEQKKMKKQIQVEPKTGYHPMIGILTLYRELDSEFHKKVFSKILDRLQTLQKKYKGILVQTDSYLNQMPQPTNIFLEIYHYKVIYSDIVSWFSKSMGDKVDGEDFQFCSADRIYEYYCLIRMKQELAEICKEKSELELEPKSELCFSYIDAFCEELTKQKKYSSNHIKKIKDTAKTIYTQKVYKGEMYEDIANTFVFEKKEANGDKTLEITLYYQPVVFVEFPNVADVKDIKDIQFNGIALNRKSAGENHKSNRPYYTPDFIIKVIEKGMTEAHKAQYHIFDSKWSNYLSITERPSKAASRCKDVYKKYGEEIRICFQDEPNTKCWYTEVDSCWIMQGKEDQKKRESITGIREKPELVKGIPLNANTQGGIFKLMPQNDNKLNEILGDVVKK